MRRRRKIQEGSRRPTQPKHRPHFFKIILRSSLESGELMIPEEFTRQFENKIPDVAVLKVPCGRNWQVEVKKVDGSVRFQNGWRGFLKYYSVSVGQFLVFRYDGNSNFSVLIFDRSACEIHYQSYNDEDDLEEDRLHTECLKPVKKEPEEEEDSMETLDANPLPSSTKEVLDKAQKLQITKRRPETRSSARKRRRNRNYQELRELGDWSGPNGVKGKGPTTFDVENEIRVIEVPSDNPNNETNMSTSTETSSHSMDDNAQHPNPDADNLLPATHGVESNCLERQCRKEISTGNSRPTAKPNAGNHLDCSPMEHENVSTPSSRRYNRVMAARKRLVTDEQREKTICAARMFKTKNPSTMIIMRPTYVSSSNGMSLNLTNSFGKKFMNIGKHNIKLSVSDGRTWMVRCIVNDHKCMLSLGWTKFAHDNKLKKGDCCVFELSKARGILLKVSIFRVVEEAEPVLKYNK